ncbi:peptidyl-prolyl cis-trans isomerase [Fragilaria crotonensis]|nr:peptidyl-prolyl cis-trans isomerase [Fragilaria crotonensis]
MKSLIRWCVFLLPCSSLVIRSSPSPRQLLTKVRGTLCSENQEPCEAADDDTQYSDPSRRKLFACTAASLSFIAQPANAAKKSLLLVNPKKVEDERTLKIGTVDTSPSQLSVERCLLQLLPVKKEAFRRLENYVLGLSSLRSQASDPNAIKNAQKRLESAIEYLDTNRRFLEPVFNEEDSAIFQIEKAERGERLIESFRSELSVLLAYSKVKKGEELLARQKKALLALADIGELLVGSFPYDVPTEGRFSFLPRLEGRCRVTFTFKRGNEVLGNCIILADGFAAPITAGNFVDLSLRGFYTGLPVKIVKKRIGKSQSVKSSFFSELAESGRESLGMEPEQDSENLYLSKIASLPLLGSYKEGFYDPLTARPRRIPLEILRQEKATELSRLSYEQGFNRLSDSSVGTDQNSKPVLSLEIPGLVVFNHGDRTLGSSEFFILPDGIPAEERRLLNGQYAAFGYVIEGNDILQSLQAGDLIAETTVSEFGQRNLVKIRGTSYSDVMQKGSVIE